MRVLLEILVGLARAVWWAELVWCRVWRIPVWVSLGLLFGCCWWSWRTALRLVGSVKKVVRWGDDIGAGGLGLVTKEQAKIGQRLFVRWGWRVVAAPWAATLVGLVVWRFGGWQLLAGGVLVVWLRRRARRLA